MHIETGELKRIADEEAIETLRNEFEKLEMEYDMASYGEASNERLKELNAKREIISREEALSKDFVEVPEELNESALEAMKNKICAFNSPP